MILKTKNIERLGIYFFYDKDGIADEYVFHLLKDLSKSLAKLIIVCNGDLSPKSKKDFSKLSKDIIIRKNSGFDVWAYKTALEYEGWSSLREYDEVVLLNHTIMGPVYPFKDMFEKMSNVDVDFWGITSFLRCKTIPKALIKYFPKKYIPEHIQSHFIVYRKSLLSSDDLKKFWDNIPQINNYWESVGKYESVFTNYFSNLGYKWDVYVNCRKYEGFNIYPLMFCPIELIQNEKCPIFKRKMFFIDQEDSLNNSNSQEPRRLLDYLDKEQLYDCNMILDNVLRVDNYRDIHDALHFDYFLPSNIYDKKLFNNRKNIKKIALVMYIYYQDKIEESYNYAKNMPDNIDLFISTSSKENKKEILKVFNGFKCNRMSIKLQENKGRDVSTICVAFREEIKKYDLVFFYHDKKTIYTSSGSQGKGFADNCFYNTIYNKEYVRNVINLFESNERIGVAAPPEPKNFPYYLRFYSYSFEDNYSNVVELCNLLGVKANIDKSKPPIAPYGTVFWFRPKSIYKLLDYKFTYNDFPSEPIGNNKTLLHAIERSYQFIAQDAGYITCRIFSDYGASIDYGNLEHIGKKSKDWFDDIIMQYKNSMSWKITKPLRIVGSLINKIKNEK